MSAIKLGLTPNFTARWEKPNVSIFHRYGWGMPIKIGTMPIAKAGSRTATDGKKAVPLIEKIFNILRRYAELAVISHLIFNFIASKAAPPKCDSVIDSPFTWE